MQLDFEFKTGNNEKYKIDGIQNSAIYIKEPITGQLSWLYYLVLWKSYLEEKNTWEPALAIQYLLKTYHCLPQGQFKETDSSFSPC